MFNKCDCSVISICTSLLANFSAFSALTRLGGRKGIWPVKNGWMVEVGTG